MAFATSESNTKAGVSVKFIPSSEPQPIGGSKTSDTLFCHEFGFVTNNSFSCTDLNDFLEKIFHGAHKEP